MKQFLLTVFVSLSLPVGAQEDTLHGDHHHDHDSVYMITENPVKNRFWGNSFHVSAAYMYSRSNELDLSFGRTYGRSSCGGAGCVFNMDSWGLSYGYVFRKGEEAHIGKAFWEQCLFYFPPISVGYRAEYLYDFSSGTHYLRPSLGFSFFVLDIFYSYSFRLNGTENLFQHGVSVRLKFFPGSKKWEKHYPSRC